MHDYLTMAILNNWHAKAIDFDQACTQADCDAGIYLRLKAGFHIKNKVRYVIKLIQNLCVLRQEGHNFYEKFKSELENRGHIQSADDPYTFCKNGVIVIYWFYDCLLFAQTSELSNELLASLKEHFLYADESETDRCIGVEIKTTENVLTLNQTVFYFRLKSKRFFNGWS